MKVLYSEMPIRCLVIAVVPLLLMALLVGCSSSGQSSSPSDEGSEANDAIVENVAGSTEATPVGDSGKTTTIEAGGVMVTIGDDWVEEDRGDNLIWYVSDYPSNALVAISVNEGDYIYDQLEQEAMSIVDGILDEVGVGKQGRNAKTIDADGVVCAVATVESAVFVTGDCSLCAVVVPLEGKAVSMIYSIDSKCGKDGINYLESLAEKIAVSDEEKARIEEAQGVRAQQKKEEEQKAAEERAAAEARANATHPAGSYKVGSDIPAGEYKLNASKNGYFCVYPDTSKNDILENDNFSSCTYITVEDGQYIEIKRCTMTEVEYAEATTPHDDGMYKVGFDIPEGEYKLISNNNRGYYCIYDNSTVYRDIQDNDNFEGSTYCYVYDGQYLVLNRASIEN